MKVSDFDFQLPEELVAKYPPERRGLSRLLHVDGAQEQFADRMFSDLPALLKRGDLLVFNNTKVVPARVFAKKETGGALEILFERKLTERSFLAHVRASKSPKTGSIIFTEGGAELEMLGRQGALFELGLTDGEVFHLLEQEGHVPLPPYIDRADEKLDGERYQTVYAKEPGAAAAPTAGLHFDDAMLARLEEQGVNSTFVTLHVGAGTFQPVKVERVEEHVMHSEWIHVGTDVVEQIRNTKEQGGRVVCVGTTSMRSLEAASQSGRLAPYEGDTDIFMYPGYEFVTVDALITNFHLPQSTLLMLVSAFCGQEIIKQAYQHAIDERYRFFSYGDAMFLEPATLS